jgi:hypothetical protein
VANEWRSEWQLAGLTIPASRIASFTARCRLVSLAWWRRILPDPGYSALQGTHFLVQKHQRVERLVLRRGGHLPLHGQIRQKPLDFRRPHFPRMTFAMEENKAFDPLHVSVLGSNGIMFDSDHFSDLIQMPQFRIGNNAKTGSRCSLCLFHIQPRFDRSI